MPSLTGGLLPPPFLEDHRRSPGPRRQLSAAARRDPRVGAADPELADVELWHSRNSARPVPLVARVARGVGCTENRCRERREQNSRSRRRSIPADCPGHRRFRLSPRLGVSGRGSVADGRAPRGSGIALAPVPAPPDGCEQWSHRAQGSRQPGRKMLVPGGLAGALSAAGREPGRGGIRDVRGGLSKRADSSDEC